MIHWLIQIPEKNVAEYFPTDAAPKLRYDANMNLATLTDGPVQIEIYAQSFEEMCSALFAFDFMRVAPTSGPYEKEPIKQAAWELMQRQLAGMEYTSLTSSR